MSDQKARPRKETEERIPCKAQAGNGQPESERGIEHRPARGKVIPVVQAPYEGWGTDPRDLEEDRGTVVRNCKNARRELGKATGPENPV